MTIEEYVRAVVDSAPPLSETQRAEIRLIFLTSKKETN